MTIRVIAALDELLDHITVFPGIAEGLIIISGTDAAQDANFRSLELLSGNPFGFLKQLFSPTLVLGSLFLRPSQGDFRSEDMQLPDESLIAVVPLGIYPQP